MSLNIGKESLNSYNFANSATNSEEFKYAAQQSSANAVSKKDGPDLPPDVQDFVDFLRSKYPSLNEAGVYYNTETGTFEFLFSNAKDQKAFLANFKDDLNLNFTRAKDGTGANTLYILEFRPINGNFKSVVSGLKSQQSPNAKQTEIAKAAETPAQLPQQAGGDAAKLVDLLSRLYPDKNKTKIAYIPEYSQGIDYVPSSVTVTNKKKFGYNNDILLQFKDGYDIEISTNSKFTTILLTPKGTYAQANAAANLFPASTPEVVNTNVKTPTQNKADSGTNTANENITWEQNPNEFSYLYEDKPLKPNNAPAVETAPETNNPTQNAQANEQPAWTPTPKEYISESEPSTSIAYADAFQAFLLKHYKGLTESNIKFFPSNSDNNDFSQGSFKIVLNKTQSEAHLDNIKVDLYKAYKIEVNKIGATVVVTLTPLDSSIEVANNKLHSLPILKKMTAPNMLRLAEPILNTQVDDFINILETNNITNKITSKSFDANAPKLKLNFGTAQDLNDFNTNFSRFRTLFYVDVTSDNRKHSFSITLKPKLGSFSAVNGAMNSFYTRTTANTQPANPETQPTTPKAVTQPETVAPEQVNLEQPKIVEQPIAPAAVSTPEVQQSSATKFPKSVIKFAGIVRQNFPDLFSLISEKNISYDDADRSLKIYFDNSGEMNKFRDLAKQNLGNVIKPYGHFLPSSVGIFVMLTPIEGDFGTVNALLLNPPPPQLPTESSETAAPKTITAPAQSVVEASAPQELPPEVVIFWENMKKSYRSLKGDITYDINTNSLTIKFGTSKDYLFAARKFAPNLVINFKSNPPVNQFFNTSKLDKVGDTFTLVVTPKGNFTFASANAELKFKPLSNVTTPTTAPRVVEPKATPTPVVEADVPVQEPKINEVVEQPSPVSANPASTISQPTAQQRFTIKAVYADGSEITIDDKGFTASSAEEFKSNLIKSMNSDAGRPNEIPSLKITNNTGKTYLLSSLSLELFLKRTGAADPFQTAWNVLGAEVTQEPVKTARPRIRVPYQKKMDYAQPAPKTVTPEVSQTAVNEPELDTPGKTPLFKSTEGQAPKVIEFTTEQKELIRNYEFVVRTKKSISVINIALEKALKAGVTYEDLGLKNPVNVTTPKSPTTPPSDNTTQSFRNDTWVDPKELNPGLEELTGAKQEKIDPTTIRPILNRPLAPVVDDKILPKNTVASYTIKDATTPQTELLTDFLRSNGVEAEVRLDAGNLGNGSKIGGRYQFYAKTSAELAKVENVLGFKASEIVSLQGTNGEIVYSAHLNQYKVENLLATLTQQAAAQNATATSAPQQATGQATPAQKATKTLGIKTVKPTTIKFIRPAAQPAQPATPGSIANPVRVDLSTNSDVGTDINVAKSIGNQLKATGKAFITDAQSNKTYFVTTAAASAGVSLSKAVLSYFENNQTQALENLNAASGGAFFTLIGLRIAQIGSYLGANFANVLNLLNKNKLNIEKAAKTGEAWAKNFLVLYMVVAAYNETSAVLKKYGPTSPEYIGTCAMWSMRILAPAGAGEIGAGLLEPILEVLTGSDLPDTAITALGKGIGQVANYAAKKIQGKEITPADLAPAKNTSPVKAY